MKNTKTVMVVFVLLVLFVAGGLAYFNNLEATKYRAQVQSLEKKYSSEEVQWALVHPEMVKPVMKTYEQAHKAADETVIEIVEGKKLGK